MPRLLLEQCSIRTSRWSYRYSAEITQFSSCSIKRWLYICLNVTHPSLTNQMQFIFFVVFIVSRLFNSYRESQNMQHFLQLFSSKFSSSLFDWRHHRKMEAHFYRKLSFELQRAHHMLTQTSSQVCFWYFSLLVLVAEPKTTEPSQKNKSQAYVSNAMCSMCMYPKTWSCKTCPKDLNLLWKRYRDQFSLDMLDCCNSILTFIITGYETWK